MVVAATIIAVVAAAPASAVKFGAPDSADAYPWIGFVVGFDGQGQPLGACSGSLLSGDEFLTAAHCVKDPWPDSPFQPTEMRIWFTNEEITIDPQFYANLEELIADPEAHVDLCADVFGAPCGGYDVTGRPDAHPGWGITTRPQTSDVGMVRDLVWTGDQPPSFGVLAPPAYLDNLAYTAPSLGSCPQPQSRTRCRRSRASCEPHVSSIHESRGAREVTDNGAWRRAQQLGIVASCAGNGSPRS